MAGNYRRPFILFSAFGCFAGALMIFLGVLCCTGAWLPVAGLIIMAFAGNISPIYVALIKESNPDHRFGTAVCVGNCFAYGVSAIAGGGAGKLMDFYAPQIVDGVRIYGRNSYLLVFGVLVIAGVISALLSLMVKESKGKDISKEFE
jgi:MFS family permease